MKNSPSAIRYSAPVEPKISKKAAVIIFAGVVGLATVLLAVIR
jgi:hypothetical protein